MSLFQISDSQLLGGVAGAIPVRIRIEQDRFDDESSDRALTELSGI